MLDFAAWQFFLQLRHAASMQFAAGSSDSEEQDRGLECPSESRDTCTVDYKLEV